MVVMFDDDDFVRFVIGDIERRRHAEAAFRAGSGARID